MSRSKIRFKCPGGRHCELCRTDPDYLRKKDNEKLVADLEDGSHVWEYSNLREDIDAHLLEESFLDDGLIR